MRAKHIIDHYRDLAARTHLVMGVFALGLIVAIIVLMIVSAVPSPHMSSVAEVLNTISMMVIVLSVIPYSVAWHPPPFCTSQPRSL